MEQTETMHMGRRILLVLFLLGIVIVALGVSRNIDEKEVLRSVAIGNTEISVEVADTIRTRTKGLGGRSSLDKEGGMLFLFSAPDYYSFWMKDMLFPIDIIWIDSDFRIAGIEERISPESYPQAYRSTVPIQYVLEVNAGFGDAHKVRKGTTVEFRP